MGMDLSVKTFRHEPEYFEAGPHPVAKAVKTAAADLAAHAPVALDDSGKLVAVTSANKANIYGLLPEEAAADEEALALEDGVTAADIEVDLRKIGIFLK